MYIRFNRHLQPYFFHQAPSAEADRIRFYPYIQANLYLCRLQIAEVQSLPFCSNHIHRFIADGFYIFHICRRFFRRCPVIRKISRAGFFPIGDCRRRRRYHILHRTRDFHVPKLIQCIQSVLCKGQTLFQQPSCIGQRFFRNFQTGIINYLLHLRPKLLPVVFLRFLCIIPGIVLIIPPTLLIGIGCSAVLCLVKIIYRRLHLVLHHIFYRTVTGRRKLRYSCANL